MTKKELNLKQVRRAQILAVMILKFFIVRILKILRMIYRDDLTMKRSRH